MSVGSAVKVYRFSRGDKYSCLVKVINEGDNVIFDKIIVPAGTSDEVKAKMLDEAEKAALDLHEKEVSRRWSNS